MSNYNEFVSRKLGSTSFEGATTQIHRDDFFPHQSALANWSLRRGRSAIFADTGLGKSRMQIAWADAIHRETGKDVLILAPLAVAQQTKNEGAAIGVEVNHAREYEDVREGITITNYDRLHKFDTDRFIGVVLDESSIIKHQGAKTLKTLLDTFHTTKFKLCATATPSPNDWTELGNHAEFLGVCTRAEMLSEYFLHDGGETQKWRLKGHARAAFWKWVATWGAMIRSPADLGFDASAYELPPLNLHQHTVQIPHDPAHGLFPLEAQTLMERRNARRASLDQRIEACAKIANENESPWVIWCDLNVEGDLLTSKIEGAVQISGADDSEVKEQRLIDFANGKIRVLVSKPSICGFGLNWQHCSNMAFVGVTDSFEAYYQAVRRCWRFGQKKPVNVHLFASNQEGAVVANLKRKERDAQIMADAMASETLDAVRENILGRNKSTNIYRPQTQIIVPNFLEAAA